MRHTPLVLLISLLFFAIACTFMLDEPTGLTHGDSTIPPRDSISLESYMDVDTIYLSENKVFRYNITDNLGGYQFSANVDFDEQRIETFSDRTGIFQIPGEKFTTGAHKLKLSLDESYTDKNLITQFHNSTSTIFREWVVIIDSDVPFSFEVTTSIENGYLKYSWPAYTKSDFLYYAIKGSMIDIQIAYSTSDPSKNFIYDSTYVDGRYPSNVEVTIHNTHGNAVASSSVDEPKITLDMVFHPEDSTASFTWSKPKYYGHFKSYSISDASSTIVNVTTVENLTTTIDVLGVFPVATQLFFRLTDKDDKEITKIEKDINYFLGNAMPSDQTANQPWYYSKAANKYIGRAGGTINIYDASFNKIASRTIQDNATNGMTVAWPGNYLHYIGTGYSISELNLVSNSEISMTIPGPYTNPTQLGVVFGADNQVTSFYAIDNDHVHSVTATYGLANVQAGTFEQGTTANWSVISDDGRYTVQPPLVYSVSGTTQTNIGTLPDPYRFRFFRGDNTDEIVTSQYNASGNVELKTGIVRSSDMAVLRTFDIPEAGFSLVAYDPTIKTLLYTKAGTGKAYVINIETGKQKMFNVVEGGGTGLVNGNLVIGSRYIKIQ